jgi:hypothetical protein
LATHQIGKNQFQLSLKSSLKSNLKSVGKTAFIQHQLWPLQLGLLHGVRHSMESLAVAKHFPANPA